MMVVKGEEGGSVLPLSLYPFQDRVGSLQVRYPPPKTSYEISQRHTDVTWSVAAFDRGGERVYIEHQHHSSNAMVRVDVARRHIPSEPTSEGEGMSTPMQHPVYDSLSFNEGLSAVGLSSVLSTTSTHTRTSPSLSLTFPQE
jgi:hypothetical protein